MSRHARPSLLDTFARCRDLALAAAAAAADQAPLAPLAHGPGAVDTAALGPPLSERERCILDGFSVAELRRIEAIIRRLGPAARAPICGLQVARQLPNTPRPISGRGKPWRI
jgi:hypothetical protein